MGGIPVNVKKLLLIIIACLVFTEVKSQVLDKYSAMLEISNKAGVSLEGFDKSIGYNDFTYHSLRDDVSEALLIRCQENLNKAEWYTSKIPEQYSEPVVSFMWIAALNMVDDPGLKVDLYVNDVKRFEVPFTKKTNWRIENAGGGALSFDACELDRFNDAHGFMQLQVPVKWCAPGSQVKITLVAAPANNSSWWIIYKAKDAVKALLETVKNNIELTLTVDRDNKQIIIDAPALMSKKGLVYETVKGKQPVAFNTSDNNAEVKINFNSTDGIKKFILADSLGELLNFEDITKAESGDKIINDAVQRVYVKKDGNKIIINVSRSFAPYVANSIKKIAKSKIATGTIYLMNSSHQDIAWMDTPEKCIIDRDTMLIAPLYKKAMADSNYRFDIEDALMLREFVARHPDKKDGIKKLLHNGQITCGSTYNMPYEEMYSGESLIREFYLGARWLKKEFDYSPEVYWNVDVPGRTLQMPQIMKKAGTKYLVLSRFEEGIYNWYSPDGSFITAYTPGHYGNAMLYLTKDFFAAASAIAENSLKWEKYFSGDKPASLPILSDSDMSPAKDYSPLIERWSAIKEINQDGIKKEVILPPIKVATAVECLNSFTANADNIPAIRGERPAVWLYIQHPSHKAALDASRKGDMLLTAAEKFSSLKAMIENDISDYPAEELNKAWEAKIYPDHGWGGKGGEVTDALFKDKFLYAQNQGERIVKDALNSIASNIKTDKKKGIPIVIFNSLGFTRNIPAKYNMQFNEGYAKGIRLFDAGGKEIKCSVTDPEYYKNSCIKSATIEFVAGAVPSVGYETFYVKPDKNKNETGKIETASVVENKYYQIELCDKGIKRIYDKELKQELLGVSKFYGGEIFTMKSVGEDAGEFADIQHPTMEGFDKTSNYSISWQPVMKNGVYSSVKFRQQIKNAIIEEEIILFNDIKRIDFNVVILNWEGVMFREYRMAFPLNMNDGQVSYQVPFGVVNVGKDELEGAAGERYIVPCEDIHPRGIENWISTNSSRLGVTISSSAGVVDYIDPTNNPVKQQIIQPVLIASRRSCHAEGPEYPQTGDHYFHFTLTSHMPGWQNGYYAGMEGNEPFYKVVNPQKYEGAALPEKMSFFSTGSKNILISTIKKAEDENGFVVRLYEGEGRDTVANLSSFKPINEIFKTNIIENDAKKIVGKGKTVQLEIGKNSIETYLIK
jgi:alpha-mannosidase